LRKKIILLVVLASLMVLAFALPAYAAANTTSTVYGTGQAVNATGQFVIGKTSYTVSGAVYNMDAAPYILNGRTLVPVRYLADELGAQTAWNPTTQTVTVTKGSTTIDLVIGSTVLTVNGTASPMDVAPVINNSRTYLPARYVAEALGANVAWNASNQTVTITAGSTSATSTSATTTSTTSTSTTTTSTTTTPTTSTTTTSTTTPATSTSATTTPTTTTSTTTTNAFEAWLQAQPGLFDAAKAMGINGAYQFNVTDTADKGLYWIKIANDQCTVGEGAVTSPKLTINTPEQVWLDVAADTLAGSPKGLGMTDYLNGAYTTSGDVTWLSSMSSYFHK
jgi:hypothetical protein